MLDCPMAKEPHLIATKANTEVTIILVIDSSLTIEKDLTSEDIPIPALCEGFTQKLTTDLLSQIYWRLRFISKNKRVFAKYYKVI